MTRLIDARTSMGLSTTDLSPDPFPVGDPVLAGQVGLNVPQSTPGIIRIQFDGVIGAQLGITSDVTITLTLVNGTLSTDPIVYQSITSYTGSPASSNNILIPLSASVYNIPAPVSGLLIYSLYVTVSAFILRSGPESLNASAYTDN